MIMQKKSKNISIENLLSVNALLAVVIVLELLIALYLIVSQNTRLKALYDRSVAQVKDISLDTGGKKPAQSSPSANLLLKNDKKTLAVGKQAEIEILLDLSKPETLSAIESRLKYDPDYIKVENIITRSLFKKANEKDDPALGLYSVIFYSEKGERVEKSLGLATITITPLRKGETTLEFLFEKGADKSTSTVVRFTNPANILQKTGSLDIVIE